MDTNIEEVGCFIHVRLHPAQKDEIDSFIQKDTNRLRFSVRL